MKTLQEIVAARLNDLRLGPVEAATASGMERTFIRDIVEGKKKSIRADKLFVLAEALKLDAIALAHNELLPIDEVEPKGVPLISWVSAGALSMPDYVPDDWDDVPHVDGTGLDPNGDWIALRVDGRSMDKVSPHDSIIFVNRKDKQLVPNGLYVIGDGNGGATYKRFRPPNTFEPVTTKPDIFKPITVDGEPDVIGRVRRSVLDM